MRKRIKHLVIVLLAVLIISCGIPVSSFAAEVPYTRIYGSNRYETSMKIAEYMAQNNPDDKMEAFILVSGSDYPDALSGSFLASHFYCPIMLVNDDYVDEVISFISKNISNTGTVYILGGTSAVSANVENRISSKFHTVRISGANRYKTNLNIVDYTLDYIGWSLDDVDVFICSGQGYADCLSASSTDCPIIIVDSKKGITNEQLAFLKKHKANRFLIAGGTKAVPSSVQKKLSALGTVKRFNGKNRYDTSGMIAHSFSTMDKYNLVVASGENFPDGLCASALAQVTCANLILCNNKNITDAESYVRYGYGVQHGYVIASPSLISEEAVQTIFADDGQY